VVVTFATNLEVHAMARLLAIFGVPLVIAGVASCGSNGSSGSEPIGPGSGADGSTPGDDGSSGGGSDATIGADDGSSGSSSGGATDGSTTEGGAQSDSGTAGSDPSVYQHHNNGTRNGLYIDPVLTSGTSGNAATMHVVSGAMGTVSTAVYAQPLYVENGPMGKEAFIVATESNHVTALDAQTGAVLWDKGPPTAVLPNVTGGLPCGDVVPLGITGTPIISNGVIYFDAMTSTDDNVTLKHQVYAMNVSDGSVLANWPVDVSAKISGFNSPHQNERGALQLVNGVLYVPYGGHDGDCDPYFGWVVGFPINNPQSPTGWHTVASRGGIWGPGALPTDGTSIFPITGNTEGANGTWGGGEAVIRLAAGPTFSGATKDYYAPTNWQDLDNGDTDLGGASEVIFDMPGASTPHLIAAGGKDSNLYLLNRDNLGGIGHELLKQSVATNQIKGAPAVYTTKMGTYVAFHIEGGRGVGCPTASETGNLVAVKITAGASGFTAKVAWCSAETGLASPMVTTTDGTSDAIVWDANSSLWAYDGDTGTKLFAGSSKTQLSTAIQGWNTPIAVGKGRIAVAVNGALNVFQAP
jgi:hypothetical protein